MTTSYRATKEYIDVLEAIDNIRVHWDDANYDLMNTAHSKVFELLASYSMLLNQFQIQTLLGYLARTETRVGFHTTLEKCSNPA